MGSFLVPVFFLDGSSKIFRVDEETTLEELQESVADAIDLKEMKDDFRFFLTTTTSESLLQGELHLLDLIDPQEVSASNPSAPRIIYKRVFFMDPKGEKYSDPVFLHFMFAQARDQFLKGMWAVTFDQAAELGGLLLVATYGGAPEVQTPGFVRPVIRSLLPETLFWDAKPKVWGAQLLRRARERALLTPAKAKRAFLTKIRAYAPDFGTTFFPARYDRRNDTALTARVLVGVSSQGVALLNAADMSSNGFYRFVDMVSWGFEERFLTVTTRLPDEAAEVAHRLEMDNPHNVTTLISGYVQRILRALNDE